MISKLPELTARFGRTEPTWRGEREVAAAVWSLLGTHSQQPVVERRRDQRFPYPYPVRLTPILGDGTVSPDEWVMVLGKHVTEHGMDFYFNSPLPYRRVVATFERGNSDLLHIAMDLTWCRFGRHGWYENGGRFLNLLPSVLPVRVSAAS